MIAEEEISEELFPTAQEIVYEQNKTKTQLRSKVMQLRYELKQQGITKTGHNNFQNYDHYTIDDILRQVYPLLMKYHLATWYHFDKHNNTATLEITDLNTGYTDKVTIEDPTLQYKNSNDALQGLGKSQTYLRKYLYIQLLDLSESDPDTTFGEQKTKPIDATQNKKSTKNTKNNNTQNNITPKKSINKQKITYKIPKPIQYMITELQEKQQPITRNTLRNYTTQQLQQQLINQKEYNTLINIIQQIPEEQLQ